MELRHLRYFVVAAEEENFHRAAERLHLAQSALSRQIQDLEKNLGVVLFDRYKKRVRLSEAGRHYFEHARRILRDIDHANDSVRRVAQGVEGRLRISVHYASLRNPAVPHALHAFRSSYPQVELQLSHLLSSSQLEAVRSGHVDAGFNLHERPKGERDLELLETGEDRFVLAVPALHPLLERETLRLADLAGEPFLWLERSVSAGAHDRLMNACLAGGLSPRIVQHVLNQETCPNLVSVGMGLAFVLASTQHDESKVAFREVSDLNLRPKLDLIWRKDNTSSTLERFVEIVKDTVAAAMREEGR